MHTIETKNLPGSAGQVFDATPLFERGSVADVLVRELARYLAGDAFETLLLLRLARQRSSRNESAK